MTPFPNRLLQTIFSFIATVLVAHGQSTVALTEIDTHFPTNAETHLLRDMYPEEGRSVASRRPSQVNPRRSMGLDFGDEMHRHLGFASGYRHRRRFGYDLEFARGYGNRRYDDYVFEAPESAKAPVDVPFLEVVESRDEESYGSAAGRLGLPITRDADPEHAHFKAGPFYFDLIAASARLLFTDFQSADREPPEGDGWLRIWELTGRAYVDITDDLAITLAGTIYYLPEEGEIGVDLAADSRSFARIEWRRRVGDWDLLAYDEFRVLHRVNDLLDPIEVDEIERAGRYRFGRRDDHYRSNRYFDDRSLVYRNLMGLQAATLLLPQWLFTIAYERADYWRTADFDDHFHRDRARARIGYVGDDVPFAPYVSYEGTSRDEWDSASHRVWHGGRGRITEDVRFFGRVGYHWNTGDRRSGRRDKALHEAGFIHDINGRTRHSLFGGSIYAEDRFGDDGRYKYARYSLAHRWEGGNVGRAFAGVSDHEDNNAFSRWQAGASLDSRIGEYNYLYFLTRYERTSDAGDDGADSTRWIHEATASRQLGDRLHASITYRHEDFARQGGSFDEHLVSFSLTRTF